MKKQSTTLLTQMSQAQLSTLTHIVKETLAMEFHQPATRVFTAADLWSIQRHGKTRTQRRFSL